MATEGQPDDQSKEIDSSTEATESNEESKEQVASEVTEAETETRPEGGDQQQPTEPEGGDQQQPTEPEGGDQQQPAEPETSPVDTDKPDQPIEQNTDLVTQEETSKNSTELPTNGEETQDGAVQHKQSEPSDEPQVSAPLTDGETADSEAKQESEKTATPQPQPDPAKLDPELANSPQDTENLPKPDSESVAKADSEINIPPDSHQQPSSEDTSDSAQQDSDKTDSSGEQSGQSSAPTQDNDKDDKTSKPVEEATPPESSRPGTDKSRQESADKKEKKEKKKDKKREKKKSRQTSRTEPVPAEASGSNRLEAILLSHFNKADLENSGHINSAEFWQIIKSGELNLQLGAEQVASLQELIKADPSGLINYADFSTRAAELIASLHKGLPESDDHLVLLASKDQAIVVSFNKKTGETKESVSEQIDLFGGVIENFFRSSDSTNKGYITPEEFAALLQSEQMVPYLSNEDIVEMNQYFSNIPGGRATYNDFLPLGRELILRVYRAKDPSESEWCQLDSPQGLVWFNKFTGETRRDATDDRQQEIAFVQQAYAEVQAVTFELEQYKAQNRELQNELAQAAEEQETLATQLYETGHHLDEAAAEIEAKSRELEEAQQLIASKDREIQQILGQTEQFDVLRHKQEEVEDELKAARDTIAVRDNTVAKRDTNISELQRVSDAITDKLKDLQGEVDARDSTISSLKHKLNFQQMEAQKYEKRVGELEEHLSTTEQELGTTKQALEEKTAALLQARKHLKNSRERTLELEKDSEKLHQTQEKLRSAECEIRTLKSFLTSKTAMIEKNKKELRETRAKVAELQEKDRRRAVILADVLEKTAKQFQGQTTGSPTRLLALDSLTTPLDTRPASAPAFPPDEDVIDGPGQSQSPRVLKSFTISKAPTQPPLYGTKRGSPPQRYGAGKTKTRGRSKTVPKLPQISRAHLQKQNLFVFPTQNDIRREHWEKDKQSSVHMPTNPQCNCEMCTMNATIVQEPEASVATKGLSSMAHEMDPRELALVRQLRNGQRVVIQMKKSEFDLEPQQLTGIVRYVGKIDSEYIDNRIYVGVKLDEAAGDTDGLIKGKRYFTCPAKHGKIVRISNVVAVLPTKSVFYKPLQGIKKRSSPYGAPPKKSSSINVL